MKKRLAALAVLAAFVPVLWALTMPAHFLNTVLLGRSGWTLRAQACRWEGRNLKFKSAVLLDPQGGVFFRSGEGSVRLGFSWPDRRSADIFLKNVVLTPSASAKIVKLASGKDAIGPLDAAEAALALRSEKGMTRVHFLNVRSRNAVLKGGLLLSKGRILKANALILDARGTPLFKARWHDIILPS